MSTIGDNVSVYEIRRSVTFDAWLTNLNDSNARARIAARIDRLAMGNPGDVKPVGSGVSEMRVDYGPGYRIYFARMERVVYLLLCGRTKDTQDADIKRAIEMNAVRVSEARRRTQKKRK
jgi:putative addiction module killer protein